MAGFRSRDPLRCGSAVTSTVMRAQLPKSVALKV